MHSLQNGECPMQSVRPSSCDIHTRANRLRLASMPAVRALIPVGPACRAGLVFEVPVRYAGPTTAVRVRTWLVSFRCWGSLYPAKNRLFFAPNLRHKSCTRFEQSVSQGPGSARAKREGSGAFLCFSPE